MVALAAKPVPRMELFVCDASWRLLERRTDESWNGSGFTHDSTSQWVWGQRYIDELVASITDGDANSDGAVNLDDQDIVLANFGKQIGDTGGTATYKVEADFDSNGAIDLDDLSTVFNHFGTSIDRGRLSGSGNIVGYAGYIFEPATGMYVVRHRWYSTENGRWLSRDRLGYIDGTSVYEYCRGGPLKYTDPTGEACTVWYTCRCTAIKIVGKNRNKKRCTYACTAVRWTESVGSGLDCDSIAKTPIIRDVYIVPCDVCPDEKNQSDMKRYMDTAIRWGDCSRRECRAACAEGKDISKVVCAVVKNKVWKALCYSMTRLAEYTFEDICDAFCKNT